MKFALEHPLEKLSPPSWITYCHKLPLQEFSSNLGESDNNEQIVLFLRQQMNVEKLVLYCESQFSGFPFQIAFNHLRHLEMNRIDLNRMDFFQFLPNLATLILWQPPESDANKIAQTDIAQVSPRTKITTLTILYAISTSDVEKLILLLPGILKAKLHLADESFRLVKLLFFNSAKVSGVFTN